MAVESQIVFEFADGVVWLLDDVSCEAAECANFSTAIAVESKRRERQGISATGIIRKRKSEDKPINDRHCAAATDLPGQAGSCVA